MVKSGKPDAREYWRKAHDTMKGMKARGLHILPQDERFVAWLRAKVVE
jgi:hypothetical protein